MARKDQEKIKRIADSIDQQAQNPLAAKAAVGFLFPNVFRDIDFYSDDASDIHQQRANFRIANRDFSNAYFRLEPGKASWDRNVVSRLTKTKSPRRFLQEIESRIRAASKSDQYTLRRTILEQLVSTFETRTTVFTQSWLNAIVAFSPNYLLADDETSELMFSIDFITRLEFVVVSGLKQLDSNESAKTFRSSIRAAKDMSLLCSTFRTIAGDVNKQGDTERDEAVDFGEDTDSIRQLLIAKVESIAQRGEFWKQAVPDRILWFWWGAGHPGEVREFTNREMRHRKGLEGLLKISVSLVRSTAGNYNRVAHAMDKVVNTKLLLSQAEDLVSRGDANGRKIARIFIDAYKHRE